MNEPNYKWEMVFWMSISIAEAFLILCFGIGRMISGG